MKHDLFKYLGRKFNDLTIISKSNIKGNGQMVKVKCDCGNEIDLLLAPIINNRQKSCGCRHTTINGLSSHPLYYIWGAMYNRCYDKKCKEYKYYGNKGIRMCDEWLNSFLKFYEWAINNGWQKGMHIDRIKNHMHYAPDNCRFLTQKESANNKTNNVYYTINGEQYTLARISEIYNIPYKALHLRLTRGWDIVRAITSPLTRQRKGIKHRQKRVDIKYSFGYIK